MQAKSLPKYNAYKFLFKMIEIIDFRETYKWTYLKSSILNL